LHSRLSNREGNRSWWGRGVTPTWDRIGADRKCFDQPESRAYSENSQATAALVLGILGVVGCVVTGPFAWYLANQEIKAIDEGRRDPANRGQATAGKVLGIIGTVFLVLALLLLLGLLFLLPVSVGISDVLSGSAVAS
jgi:hypothetical protein